MLIMGVMCVLGCFMMIIAYRLGIGALNDPGPGLMPMIIGAFLSLLSLGAIGEHSWRKPNVKEKAETKAEDPINRKKVVIVLGSLLLYGVLLEPLGFPVTTFLFLFSMFWLMGVGRNASLIASAMVALANYFGFSYLGLRFPPGLFRYLGFY